MSVAKRLIEKQIEENGAAEDRHDLAYEEGRRDERAAVLRWFALSYGSETGMDELLADVLEDIKSGEHALVLATRPDDSD